MDPTTLSHVTFTAPAELKILSIPTPPIEQLSKARLLMLCDDASGPATSTLGIPNGSLVSCMCLKSCEL